MRPLPALGTLVLMAACAPRNIEGTKVPDTKENRVIADLVERYRVAVERRDVDALREMMSRRYFENAGTTANPDDDYGYDQFLTNVLPLLQNDVKSVQFYIYLQRIAFQGDRAMAEYEYYYKFYYVDGGKDRWAAKNDFARLEFVLEDGVWRIVGGM